MSGFAKLISPEEAVSRCHGEPSPTVADFQNRAKRRDRGEACDNCGGEIWALGSTVVGWSGCFSCITGEADSSDDFELA